MAEEVNREDLISAAEVARRLGYKSPRTIILKAATRKIPAYWIDGAWRFDPREIEAWLESKRKPVLETNPARR